MLSINIQSQYKYVFLEKVPVSVNSVLDCIDVVQFNLQFCSCVNPLADPGGVGWGVQGVRPPPPPTP